MTDIPCLEPSLADRVLTYVLNNPEDKPTADDIAALFGGSRKTVHTKLAHLVESGQLVRAKNEDGEYIYTAGRPQAIQRKPATTKTVIDWSAIPIDTAIPVPDTQVVRKSPVHAKLDQLKAPGHCFAVPADAKGVSHMRRVITQRHKNTPLRYRYAQQGELLRVWRTA